MTLIHFQAKTCCLSPESFQSPLSLCLDLFPKVMTSSRTSECHNRCPPKMCSLLLKISNLKGPKMYLSCCCKYSRYSRFARLDSKFSTHFTGFLQPPCDLLCRRQMKICVGWKNLRFKNEHQSRLVFLAVNEKLL